MPQFELLWSYKGWIEGNIELGKQIIANMAMFIPFGFFLSCFLSKRGIIIPAAGIFSLTIEFLQLVLMRGTFEWDDIISNMLGAALGIVLYSMIRKLYKGSQLSKAVTSVAVVFGMICIAVFIHGQSIAEVDSASKAFCFQVDEADITDNKLALSGVCFQYDRLDRDYVLELKSANNKRMIHLTAKENKRQDAAEYFGFEDDDIGFTATGEIDSNEEYEIMIKIPWTVLASTGVYVSTEGVHYASDSDFTAPDIEEDFVKSGTLRAFCPDHHCWVYQYDDSLYWIVDQDFCFEDDGSTIIQYHLWTTQINRLPQKRLDNGHFWDNKSGSFEDFEVKGDFGNYRVMKRELPAEYPVASIETGYYKDGKWIWREYFRPYYDFK